MYTKNMFKLDENKIEFELGNRSFGFLAGQESFLYFLRRNFRCLFVSDSWYCQIETTRLIMFFSAEFRALYTIDEDERILRHFLGHGGFSIRK